MIPLVSGRNSTKQKSYSSHVSVRWINSQNLFYRKMTVISVGLCTCEQLAV